MSLSYFKHTLMLLASITTALIIPANVIAGDILPTVPKAQAQYSPTQGCVEPTDEMRKNHMNYILHQRDETVHEGIREKQHSLTECINCHVAPSQDGQITRVDSEEHFCNSCHIYAAVSIDCFQCHTDQPTNTSQSDGELHHGFRQSEQLRTSPPPQKNLLSLFPAGGLNP